MNTCFGCLPPLLLFEPLIPSFYVPTHSSSLCRSLHCILFPCSVSLSLSLLSFWRMLQNRSDYVARREGELPVLTRWFPHDKVTPPTAAFLDIILYSKEQIDKEDAAMGSNESSSLSNQNYQWGIVSIKAQNEEFELPMAPITMMRNALGITDGGSGVALDRDAYARSVAYWKEHANVL
ncbi:DUF3228 domain-containing protein [Balamuthia mandrillaris]